MKEAKEWVKEQKVSIEEILFDDLYERARERGVERVRQAVDEGIVREVAMVSEADCIMEIFSYPIARMIVASVESDYLVRRYALAEAKKAYESMKNEEGSFIDYLAREMGVEVSGNEIYFTDYLKYAPTWDINWKLVNREMRKGYVLLSKSEVARLIQEAIRKKIYNELAFAFAPPEVKKVFKDEILGIKNKVIFKEEKRKVGEVKEEGFPPCIKNLIAAVKAGINVPHVGRFTLVTFLNAVGMDIEEILKIFASSPDFNAEKTRYQIEHITGRISGTVYATPKCDTIRTWGLCYPDEYCRNIRHPLFYYRRRARK
ncbi:MAG: DNA primase large subunit PriL [Thermoplasmata archaeon]|nr:DNA primase large subunit PriL [Thermoplasmata archaeon]